jgi:hypothetical protein
LSDYPDQYETMMQAATLLGCAASFAVCVVSLWANKVA